MPSTSDWGWAEFNSGKWSTAFRSALNEFPQGQESLMILESESVQLREILQYLYIYTHPNATTYQRQVRAWARKLTHQLGTTERLMRKSAEALEEGLTRFTTVSATWRTNGEHRAAGNLRDVAQTVRSMREHYKRISSQKGKARAEEFLVYFCLLIQARTGRPHWDDIASLLEVAYQARGRAEEHDKDSVSHIFSRFKKAHSKLFEEMRGYIFRTEAVPERVGVAMRRSTRNRRISQASGGNLIDHADHSPGRLSREQKID